MGIYRDWLASRVQRLVTPTFPVLLAWAVLAVILTQAGPPRAQIRMATEVVTDPRMVPCGLSAGDGVHAAGHTCSRRFGWPSFAAFIPAAMLTDWLTFAVKVPYVITTSVFLVSTSSALPGAEGRFNNRLFAFSWFAVGLAVLLAITVYGLLPGFDKFRRRRFPPPLPPTLALFALGMVQIGLVLTLERRWCRMLIISPSGPRP